MSATSNSNLYKDASNRQYYYNRVLHVYVKHSPEPAAEFKHDMDGKAGEGQYYVPSNLCLNM